MASLSVSSRFNKYAHVVAAHDMWTFQAALMKGDVDDLINCFYLASICRRLTIYVTNDTGDKRRHKAFMDKYGAALTFINPGIRIVSGDADLGRVDKFIICAPLHAEHDASFIQQALTHRKGCKYYAQGDAPGAYNMNGSALTPHITFGESPSITVCDEEGTRKVPMTLYNTGDTNRKFELDKIRKYVHEEVVHDILVYAKHKLCFLPQLPFAIGLLMKKYGTGNTAYGLCHVLNLMELNDTTDPDVAIQKYFRDKWGDVAAVRTDTLLYAYPAVDAYIQHTKTIGAGKLDTTDDFNIFKRAMALVVECTIIWFGPEALDRFRTIADSDIQAKIDGTERYTPSMFDLVVGVAAMHDLTPQELREMLPGTANQLAEGSFLDLF